MKLNDLRKKFAPKPEPAKPLPKARSRQRKRGFPCYRCRGKGTIKSEKTGDALCMVCVDWLVMYGWESITESQKCAICLVENDGYSKPVEEPGDRPEDAALWRRGHDVVCQKHAITLQEGWLANADPLKGECEVCGADGFVMDLEGAPHAVERKALCDDCLRNTVPVGVHARQVPREPDTKPARRGFPGALRCVRCKTTKHVESRQVSLGDGRIVRVRICRECEEERSADMDDVFR